MRRFGRNTASGLALVLAGCMEPLHVAWHETQPIIAPVRREPQVAAPHGILTVSSERYLLYHGDVPRITRRAVAVYTVDGQVAASERIPDSEAPLHFVLSPGQYIVVAQSHGHWRRVQVEVQEGHETVVVEAQLNQGLLAAASQGEPTPPLMTGRSSVSR